MNETIYLDYQATTPVDPRVLEAMLPYFSERFGNPASVQHDVGRDAGIAIDRAREQVAALIGADRREIVFCSGATEANNLALKGIAAGAERRHLVVLATEHPAVLDTARSLARDGFEVTELPVERDGQLSLTEARGGDRRADPARLDCRRKQRDRQLGAARQDCRDGA